MPDIWLDVDTAVIVPVNIMPLLDDTDFKSIETAVVYNSAGLAVTWNFVTAAGVVTGTAVTPTTAGVYDWSEPIADKGMYAIEIPASGGASINNDTEGVGWFTGVATGVLPWRGPTIGFRRAALNDLLMDGSTASTNLENFFDGTGYVGGTAKLTVDTTKVGGTPQTAGDLAAMITVVDDLIDTEVGAIKTKTDFLPSILAGNAGGLMIAGSNAATTFATLTVTGATIFTGNVAYSNGITITQATLNGHGISVTGNGTGKGINAVGGSGASGHGIYATSGGGNADGMRVLGTGTGMGLRCQGGGTAGNGIAAEAGAGGYDFSTNIQGNLSGSVGSVTGAVGSVTAGVTLAATATSAQLVDDILDEVISEAAHTTANSLGLLIRKIAYILGHTKMNITDATGAIAVRNAADSANVWTGTVSDDSTTTVRTALA